MHRGNSIATRNQRQAALNSFIHYLMYEFPEYLAEFQLIVGLPVKKAPQKEISYLKTEGVRLLFEQVDLHKRNGQEIVPKEEARWENNTRLKEWLKNFNRR